MSAGAKLSENTKVAVLGALMATALFLIYFFHFVLESGVVFTQFFYLPIVLGAIWYYYRGVAVAFFLGGALVVSDLLVGDYRLLLDDLMDDHLRRCERRGGHP